jgi:nucleoside-diphosphate-sugar epimerase
MTTAMSKAPKQGVAVITGASGFIGSRLRDKLLDDGLDVVALVRKDSPAPARGRGAAVDYADLTSLERVLESERPEFVYHVAGSTKGVTYADFQRGNVLPTRNLALALRNVHDQVKRFVHVSSLTGYGPSTPSTPLVETDEPKPVEFYGQSKLEAERVLEREIGASLPWTIIRPGGVYGPRDVDWFELFKLASRRINLFFGNRDVWTSVVHVDDVVRSIIAAAKSDAAVGKGYFICDGKPRTFTDVQREIVLASGKRALDIDVGFLPVQLASVGGEWLSRFDGKPRLFNRQKAIMARQVAWTCKHDAATADFGYQPQVPLREGVAQTFDWYKTAGWL